MYTDFLSNLWCWNLFFLCHFLCYCLFLNSYIRILTFRCCLWVYPIINLQKSYLAGWQYPTSGQYLYFISNVSCSHNCLSVRTCWCMNFQWDLNSMDGKVIFSVGNMANMCAYFGKLLAFKHELECKFGLCLPFWKSPEFTIPPMSSVQFYLCYYLKWCLERTLKVHHSNKTI